MDEYWKCFKGGPKDVLQDPLLQKDATASPTKYTKKTKYQDKSTQDLQQLLVGGAHAETSSKRVPGATGPTDDLCIKRYCKRGVSDFLKALLTKTAERKPADQGGGPGQLKTSSWAQVKFIKSLSPGQGMTTGDILENYDKVMSSGGSSKPVEPADGLGLFEKKMQKLAPLGHSCCSYMAPPDKLRDINWESHPEEAEKRAKNLGFRMSSWRPAPNFLEQEEDLSAHSGGGGSGAATPHTCANGIKYDKHGRPQSAWHPDGWKKCDMSVAQAAQCGDILDPTSRMGYLLFNDRILWATIREKLGNQGGKQLFDFVFKGGAKAANLLKGSNPKTPVEGSTWAYERWHDDFTVGTAFKNFNVLDYEIQDHGLILQNAQKDTLLVKPPMASGAAPSPPLFTPYMAQTGIAIYEGAGAPTFTRRRSAGAASNPAFLDLTHYHSMNEERFRGSCHPDHGCAEHTMTQDDYDERQISRANDDDDLEQNELEVDIFDGAGSQTSHNNKREQRRKLLQFGGAFGGALLTSGSFTMMAASGGF